jgi:circadian clock protein KaiC
MLQVVKQRGANPLLGRHSFKLDSSGVTCYPRQEAITVVKDVPPGQERASFGIPALDTMLGGGITQGTNTISAGAEGVGKTLLGIQFVMQGIADGERAIIITFNETPQQLVAKGQRFGLDLQTAIDQGHLRILSYPVAELNADMVAQELRDAVTSARIHRLMIDGLYEIELPLIKTERAHGFFASLITFLRSQQITTYITMEIDPLIGRELSFVGKTFSALAENVLLMRRSEVNGQYVNSIGVLKMRFSAHDHTLHEYTIEDGGVRISATSLRRPPTKRRGKI